MTLGRTEEGEVKAQFEMIHSHLQITVQSLASVRKFSERELNQEIGEKLIMPIAAAQTHATWGITCDRVLLVFFENIKKREANKELEFCKSDISDP